MKKIALMTCYVDNFGACLQAYALQTVIKTSCMNCDIIRYSPYKEYHKTSFIKRKFNYLLDLLRVVKKKITHIHSPEKNALNSSVRNIYTLPSNGMIR